MALTERFGLVRAQATFVHAAIAAADAVARDAGGFRPTDVRFFFLLFTNWVEHDVLRPEQDLDLTQIRRVLARLVRTGRARAAVGRAGPAAGQGRYALTPEGLVALIEELVDASPRRPFEEMLFLVLFAASYRDLVARGARRVVELLDPHRLLVDARRTVSAVSRDLEGRVQAGRAIERAADQARRAGSDPVTIAKQLEQVDPYQLHRVRPLSELFASLPDDVAALELDKGMSLRRRLLFEPLAERARAEIAILDALERTLREGGPRDP